MLGSRSRLQNHVKEAAPNAKAVYCIPHRLELASETLLAALCKILEIGEKYVKFVRADLNSPLLQKLCEDMDSGHDSLLLHSTVRWFSKGSVVNSLRALERT